MTGAESVCAVCGEPISRIGSHWEHIRSPRSGKAWLHQARPVGVKKAS